MQFTSEAAQENLLNEAIKASNEHSFHMKRAMDQQAMKKVLRYATEMLRELRTSLLSPKNYYALYMHILNELQYLEGFFEEMTKHSEVKRKSDRQGSSKEDNSNGYTIKELYEKVQTCGNALPRL